MNITVNDHDKISVIKEEFNNCFPYLKLDFFNSVMNNNNYTNPILNSNRTLNEYRSSNKIDIIIISKEMTVLDLDTKFREIYGLGVKIFRNSGKAWLETTVTEGWTLVEQNRQGQLMSQS